MPELDLDKKTISKKNAGFPEWLDFEKLRTEGIDYLGELSGKIWTDHNVHDPGITILEMLCYALLDLGYRTSLPAKDLFSKDPSDHSEENNFFTPSQVLSCNPLTILDYRRLLIDIPNVKNAWLTVAEDISIESICRRKEHVPVPAVTAIYIPPEPECIDFLNGLYHVYLDLEEGLTEDEKKDTVNAVKESLMAHRNLCEDFYDITILCKQKLGVCADIEISSGSDADKIFLQVVDTLRNFFSPAPKFYRLSQLINEKGKAIEDVFAGRPYDLVQSHGFVDIDEFEKIILRKEIYLSDVYNTLFSIPGVTAISNLGIQNCDGSICGDNPSPWVFKIYENHVPEFSLDCSGFQFTRNDIVIHVDASKYTEYFKLNYSYSNKTLLKYPSPGLDLEIPSGNYRPDLAEYYPLEEDFPKVYGIAEGSLPNDVSLARRAQSLQLRSYLLFFDHILAGYLSQLKNLRNLFSFRKNEPPGDHTYFINRLTNWPGLEKLLRFSTEEKTSNTLAFPVAMNFFDKSLTDGSIKDCDWEKIITAYQFASLTERDIAINQLIEDISSGNYTEHLVMGKNECYSFYIQTSSENYVIAGRGQYKHEKDARRAMESLGYLAANRKNYKPYSSAGKYSFNLGSAMSGYWNYLQLLTEDEKLYAQRRNGFLDHLLSRFAETFTDFALLSYSFLDSPGLLADNIFHKQHFLSNYPELSSTRGKAYDYRLNGWNNNNVAGIEKRFGAYTGSGIEGAGNLCHFEIVEFEEQVTIKIAWNKYTVLESEKSFENREEGEAALRSLVELLNDEKNYVIAWSPFENKYKLSIRSQDFEFTHPGDFDTQDAARAAVKKLQRTFSPAPLAEDVAPSQYRHEVKLEKKDGTYSWLKKNPITNRESELHVTREILEGFTDRNQWKAEHNDLEREKIVFRNNPDQPLELIDISGFDPYVNRVDVRDKKIIYRYTVTEPGKMFLFISEEEFEGEEAANENLLSLLFALSNPSNYRIGYNEKHEHVLQVYAGDRLLAANAIEYAGRDEAEKIISNISNYVNNHLFRLIPHSSPVKWRYHLNLSLPVTGDFVFTSRKEFDSDTEAILEASRITDADSKYDIVLNKNHELEIIDEDQPRRAAVAHYKPVEVENLEQPRDEAKQLLRFRKTINRINLDRTAPEVKAMVIRDKVSAHGDFGYRLVKKDDYHAWFRLDGNYKDDILKREKTREAFKAFNQDFHFTEICYGGEIITERKDESGKSWFHFQVQLRAHKPGSIPELVLFESVKGYSTEEEAQEAFMDQYVGILTTASDPSNYGKSIGFTEIFIHDPDTCNEVSQIVFVPTATMKYFGQNIAHATAELTKLANAYPVRSVKKSDDLFAKYFLCGKEKKEEPDCRTAAFEKDVYYFRLIHDYGTWISYNYYQSQQEALKQFYFFLILLKYRGNYHIDYGRCDCNWNLYLREILAESKDRFPTRDEAWGKTGVEKFICASQTENSFSTYAKRDECCFTFHVACGNLGLIHPCTYDSPQKRDEALKRLFRASREFQKMVKEKDPSIDWLKMASDLDIFHGERRSPCAGSVNQLSEFTRKSGLTIKSLPAIHAARHSVMEHIEVTDEKILKQKWLAHYFPISKKEFGSTDQKIIKYFVDIRLPGFCDEDLAESRPCDCDEKGKEIHCCCTGWISECCFDTCEEALRYYYRIAECLGDPENYYSVFDCDCGPYGIRFFCDCERKEREPERPPEQPIASVRYQPIPEPKKTGENNCCNEIIAFNPQCYMSPKMVCDAVERAKKLINDEGLHLVEHLLLRPHCIEDDCRCIINTCDERTTCKFTWKLPEDDPCENVNGYCFTPGTDPYSFIATAVLPAWPERYRKKENRLLVEQILHREMPAHIMLRILWLDPKDLCLFEKLYRNWIRWLAYKEVCGDHNAPCELIEFLFTRSLGCFDCEECIPCDKSEIFPDPCVHNKEEEKDPNEYVNSINKLYCWPQVCPRPRRYREFAAEWMDVEEEVLPGVPETVPDRIEAERKIDLRFNAYRELASDIHRASGNINAEKVLAFLRSHQPGISEYHSIIDDLVSNRKSPENKRILNNPEKHSLIEITTWFFIDKIMLENKLDEHRSDLKEIFKKLEKKELLPEYRAWKGKEIADYMPGVNTKDVKNLFK